MRKRPIPHRKQETPTDEAFVAEMVEIHRPLKEQYEAQGMPRPQIKAKIRDLMALALRKANEDLSPDKRAMVVLMQAAAVAAPAMARLFPDGYERNKG